jgi:hypothetical protein
MFRSPSPAGLPHLLTMLDDIPATPDKIAALLGIKPATLLTYKRAGQAPQAVMLALFWETKWGLSAADCAVMREADTYRGLAKSMEQKNSILLRQIKLLEEELARMAQESHTTGAANGPIYKVGRR